MSGGRFNYFHFKIDDTSEQIKEVLNNDIYNDYNDCYEKEYSSFYDYKELPEDEQELIKQEIEDLVEKLKDTSKRLHNLDWYLSGDYGADTYVKKLREYYE